MSWIKNESLNLILRVQLLVTLLVAIVVGAVVGFQSAMSSMLGGSISVISTAVYALIISRHKGYSANGVIRAALRAEAVKIVLIVGLLWLVFKFYADLNVISFISTFALVILVYGIVLLVFENRK